MVFIICYGFDFIVYWLVDNFKMVRNMSEKRVCDSCIHRSYPTGQRYEYFENKDIYIRDNLTGERFYMSDLDMLCNLLNNYDKDWQRKRIERALEIQKECFKIKDIRVKE